MLSLRCFSLQLLTTEVNLFNHCRREQQLQDRPCTNPGLFIPGVCVKAGKAAAGYLEGMHPRSSSFQFGFPEIWLKVVGMEGDSSWGCQGEAVAAAQAAQKLWWQGFQYYGLLCLLLFLSFTSLLYEEFPNSSFTQQNLNQSYISERNGIFQSPRLPLLWGAGWGKHQLLWELGQRGTGTPQQPLSARQWANHCHDFTGVDHTGLHSENTLCCVNK